MRLRNPFSKQNVLILTPLILVMILDLIFTLAGQPKDYWQNYYLFNEGSPLGSILLPWHPGYFVLFFAFYLLFVLFLVTNLKRPINIMVAVGFFLGHAWGSASWVSTIFYRLTAVYFINEWYLIVGYFILIAIVSGFFINRWLLRNMTS